MGDFVSNHAQGKNIGPYLVELSKHLSIEQEIAADDLDHLKKSIGHIKEIISMQQKYAGASGVTEEIPAEDLVEDAFHMLVNSIQHNHIKIIREYDECSIVTVDRHRAIQILVNLISNAKQSISVHRLTGGVLTLRVIKSSENKITIEITDNGLGISEMNQTKIFNYGFTTKKRRTWFRFT